MTRRQALTATLVWLALWMIPMLFAIILSGWSFALFVMLALMAYLPPLLGAAWFYRPVLREPSMPHVRPEDLPPPWRPPSDYDRSGY